MLHYVFLPFLGRLTSINQLSKCTTVEPLHAASLRGRMHAWQLGPRVCKAISGMTAHMRSFFLLFMSSQTFVLSLQAIISRLSLMMLLPFWYHAPQPDCCQTADDPQQQTSTAVPVLVVSACLTPDVNAHQQCYAAGPMAVDACFARTCLLKHIAHWEQAHSGTHRSEPDCGMLQACCPICPESHQGILSGLHMEGKTLEAKSILPALSAARALSLHMELDMAWPCQVRSAVDGLDSCCASTRCLSCRTAPAGT